jgi:hypothetical protein
MAEEETYIPLSERLNQDVLHDNFVPKYSALATAAPSRLVLVGVWLLFGPMWLAGLFHLGMALLEPAELWVKVLSMVLGLGYVMLLSVILYKQTRRYVLRAAEAEE